MVLREETVTGRRVLRLVSGRAGVPLPWIPDQVRNDGWWRAARGGWRRRLGGSRPLPWIPDQVRNDGLEGGGFARKVTEAARCGWNDSPETRGVKCGRRGAVRPRLPTAGLDFSASLEIRGALWWNWDATVGGPPVRCWRVTRGRFFAALRMTKKALRMKLGS